MLEQYLKSERKINRNEKYIKKIKSVYIARKWNHFDKKKFLTTILFFVSFITAASLDEGFIRSALFLVPFVVFVTFLFNVVVDFILIMNWSAKENIRKDDNHRLSIKTKKILENRTEQLFNELKVKRENGVLRSEDLEAARKILLMYNEKLNMLNKKDEVDSLFKLIELKQINNVSIENV